MIAERPAAVAAFARSLDACDGILAAHLDEVTAVFGQAALGVANLPSLGPPHSLVPSQIRIAGVLLWLREVEAAGLPVFVESLAAAALEGRINLPIDASALARFHRDRIHHMNAEERRGLYSRVLGGPGSPVPNHAFAEGFERLVHTLVQLDRQRNQPLDHLQVRAAIIGREVATAASTRAVGIAAFAARDMVARVTRARAILLMTGVAGALGGGDPWMIITRHSPAVLGREVRPGVHLTRAEAGRTLMSWLAASVPALERGKVGVSPGDPITGAAERWVAVGPAG